MSPAPFPLKRDGSRTFVEWRKWIGGAMTGAISLQESKWVVPFAAIALASLSLLRPPPHFPPPARYRIIKDAGGVEVPIEIPFRGTVLTWCGFGAGGYLGHTHSPQTLVSAGTQNDRERFAEGIWSWIYPESLQQDSLWQSQFRRRFPELETVLAFDAGAYIGGCGATGVIASMRAVGLPALSLNVGKGKNWDEELFAMARVETALVGEPERGEALIAAYKRAYADLDAELQTKTLTEHPRILIMNSRTDDWRRLYVKNARNDYRIYLPPAGVANAAGPVPQNPDAERILVMDPDMIFLMGNGQSPREFAADPRWHGLKAVIDNRLYRMPGDPFRGGGGLAGLHFQPLWVRWMAEIAHPDRLHPRLREALRQRFESEFGYRLNDEQIDQFLHIDENIGAVGYPRFTKDFQTSNVTEPSR